jgi:phosphate transport system permease protein
MMDTALQHRATTAPAPWGRVRRSRHVADRALKITCTLFTVLGAFVLGWILLMLLVEGIGGLSPAVFTETTPGPGSQGGGIANAIVGSLIMTVLGIVVATPVGVLAGTYLAEYGKTSKLAEVIRFVTTSCLPRPAFSSACSSTCSWCSPWAAIPVGLAALRSRSSPCL